MDAPTYRAALEHLTALLPHIEEICQRARRYEEIRAALGIIDRDEEEDTGDSIAAVVSVFSITKDQLAGKRPWPNQNIEVTL